MFPRNQSQSLNSRYSEVVKGFQESEPFQAFALRVIPDFSVRYSPWIELANAYDAELIARPFTREPIARGVVPEFLLAIGLNSSQFGDADTRRNESAGPFTVSVARGVLRSIRHTGKQLKWLQTVRCKKKLAAYLGKKGLTDTGYCGLTTALARHIERELQSDNDAFAQRVWRRPWAEIFAADICREFTPNDFEICRPDRSTERRLRLAIREMTAVAEEVMADPAVAVEAAWNDLQERF